MSDVDPDNRCRAAVGSRVVIVRLHRGAPPGLVVGVTGTVASEHHVDVLRVRIDALEGAALDLYRDEVVELAT